MRLKTRSDRAFTLLEMLFASALIAIALIAFQSSETSSIRLSLGSAEVYRATLLAQQTLTEFERKILKDGFDGVGKKNTGEFEAEHFPGYRWSVEILPSGLDLLVGGAQTEVDSAKEQLGVTGSNQSAPDIMKLANLFLEKSLRLVRCTVTWGPAKHPKSVVLETYIAKPDVSLQNLAQLGQKTPGQGGSP